MKDSKILFFLFTLFTLLNLSFCGRHSKDEWKSRVVYQVVTDRFAKDGDDSKSDCNVTLNTYCGGTFKGIQENLDYIKGMGFTGLWISPPLKNKDNSFHGYHNIDLYSINEHFGTSDDLKNLIEECHKKDIWVILDVVPNHMAGDLDISTFKPFNKTEHYHEACDVDEYSTQEERENCRIYGMPDLNHENSYVNETLLNWLDETLNKYDFDGIRYADVENVPKWFWSNFSKVANEYTFGIISTDNDDVEYVAEYQKYMDGVGDYPFFYTIRNSFSGSMRNLSDYYKNIRPKYTNPKYNTIFFGNHDDSRFLNECKHKNALRNALIFTLFYEGIPIIYYGDEQYFSGARDPECREAMYGKHDTSSDAYKLIKKALDIRNYEKVYDQDLNEVYADDNLYSYSRGNKILVVVTNTDKTIEKDFTEHQFKEGTKLCNELKDDDCVTVKDGKIPVKMEGEPKVFIPDDDDFRRFTKSSWISISIILLLNLFF